MRLGLLVYDDINTVSGGYLYDRRLVEHLRAQGDRVDIVNLPQHSYRQLLNGRWIDSIPGDRKWAAMLQDELCHPSLWRHNCELRERIDCPVVTIVHHLRCCEDRPAIQRWLLRRFEKRYLRSVDGFVYNSLATLQAVEELTPSLPSVHAPPGRDHLEVDIEEAHFRRRCLGSEPLRVLFVGNVIERKRVHDLIDAVSRLDPDRVRLTIVGSTDVEPPYYERLRKQVADLNRSRRIEFVGQIDRAELQDRLRESHVLAVPSSYEAYGIVYLEAMGYGVVPIGAASGGASDVFDDSEEGFLLKTGDVDRLALCLRALSEDRERLHAMALAARRRFNRHPTWARSMDRIRTFVRNLVT